MKVERNPDIMYKYHFYFIVIIAIFLGACKKNQTDIPTKSKPDYRNFADSSSSSADSLYWSVGVDPSLVTYTYYMDGESFEPESTIDYSIYYPVIRTDYNDNEQSLTYVCNFFTTEQGLINYCTQHSLPMSELTQFEEDIDQYVTVNNVEAYYDANNAMPEEYLEFEETTYDALWWFPHPVWLKVFDDYAPVGTSANIVFKYLPTLNNGLGSNWNNRIGCIQLTQGYSIVSMYDKKWYKNRLALLHGWGGTGKNATIFMFNPQGPLWWINNRAESIVIQ